MPLCRLCPSNNGFVVPGLRLVHLQPIPELFTCLFTNGHVVITLACLPERPLPAALAVGPSPPSQLCIRCGAASAPPSHACSDCACLPVVPDNLPVSLSRTSAHLSPANSKTTSLTLRRVNCNCHLSSLQFAGGLGSTPIATSVLHNSLALVGPGHWQLNRHTGHNMTLQLPACTNLGALVIFKFLVCTDERHDDVMTLLAGPSRNRPASHSLSDSPSQPEART